MSMSLVLTVVAIWLVSGAALADRRDARVLRIDIPLHAHGEQRLPIRRLIRNRGIDLDAYYLRAVVIDTKPRSRGFAQLSVGGFRSPDYRLRHKDRVHIPSPARQGGKWQLALGPGSKVRSVTAILEPRRRITRHDSHYELKSDWNFYPHRWTVREFYRRGLLQRTDKHANADQRRDARNDHRRADEFREQSRDSRRRHATRI